MRVIAEIAPYLYKGVFSGKKKFIISALQKQRERKVSLK
jgi:hypothetical protein